MNAARSVSLIVAPGAVTHTPGNGLVIGITIGPGTPAEAWCACAAMPFVIVVSIRPATVLSTGFTIIQHIPVALVATGGVSCAPFIEATRIGTYTWPRISPPGLAAECTFA